MTRPTGGSPAQQRLRRALKTPPDEVDGVLLTVFLLVSSLTTSVSLPVNRWLLLTLMWLGWMIATIVLRLRRQQRGSASKPTDTALETHTAPRHVAEREG